jgi:hypothetical protein
MEHRFEKIAKQWMEEGEGVPRPSTFSFRNFLAVMGLLTLGGWVLLRVMQ